MAQGPEVVQGGRAQGADWWLGAFLEHELGDVAIVLHDLRVPGSQASIDHVVVARSGIWVVDSKWHCKLQPELEREPCVDDVGRQVDIVADVVGRRSTEIPIRAALCFPTENWDGDARAFWVDGVLITFPPDLVERVRAAGPLDEELMGWIAARLALE